MRHNLGLDQVPGIWSVRHRRLLEHFPNLEALKAANAEELAAFPGFNQKVAGSLKEWLMKLSYGGPSTDEFSQFAVELLPFIIE